MARVGRRVPFVLFAAACLTLIASAGTGCKTKSAAAKGSGGGLGRTGGGGGGTGGVPPGAGGALATGPGQGGTSGTSATEAGQGGAGGTAMGQGTDGAVAAAGLCDDIPTEICASVGSTPAKPALAVVEPKILWQAPIYYESLFDEAGVAVAGTKVVVPAGPVIHFFDKNGKLLAQWQDPVYARIAGVVADTDGTVYGIGSVLVALDGGGSPLWQLRLRSDDPQSQISSPFVLSPDGVLYAALNDGRVIALTKAGNTLWDVNIGFTVLPGSIPRVQAGFDGTLMVASGDVAFSLLSAKDGSSIARVVNVATDVGLPLSAYPISFLRGFGGLVATVNGALEKLQLHLFDARGAQLWSSRTKGWLYADVRVTLDGRMLFFRPTSGIVKEGAWQAVRCGCQQPTSALPLASSLTAGQPVFSLVGADGTIYVGVRDDTTNPAHPAFEVVAHDPDLKVLWRKSFADQQFRRSPIIDDDGVLYMVGQRLLFDSNGQLQQAYNQLVAIQTSSPGLARTPSAARRYDKRQTGWSP